MASPSYKASSLLEKFITLSTLTIIALGVVFGIVTTRGLHRVLSAEDKVQKHLTEGEKARDQIKDLLRNQADQIAGSVNFLITGQPKPYLEQSNEARNALLSTLREIREQSNDPAVKDYLDRIGQTEMDYQLSLAKAIDARRKGPNFMAVAISVQSFIQPKRAALETLLDNFSAYTNASFDKELKRLQSSADSAATTAKRSIWITGIGVLALSAGILFMNMILLAKRHHKEKRALRSEAQLRKALEAAEVVTWERDLTNDVFEKTQRHLRLYGFTKDPPLWNFETFLRTIVPADRDAVKARILQAIESKTQYCLDFKVKWPDKSVHRVFSKGQIFVEDGKAVRICGFDTISDALDLPIQDTDADDGWNVPATSSGGTKEANT